METFSNVLSAIGAVALLNMFYFLYRAFKSVPSFLRNRFKHKIYYATVKKYRDERTEFGKGGKITGKIFYYDVTLEGKDVVALYTEKTSGTSGSKLKIGDRIKVFYNEKYEYTIDYSLEAKTAGNHILGVLVPLLTLIIIFIIAFNI